MDKDYKIGDSSFLLGGIAGAFEIMLNKVNYMNKALEEGYERSAKIAKEVEACEVFSDGNSANIDT